MVRLCSRLLMICATLALTWPLVTHASMPFLRKGAYTVHVRPLKQQSTRLKHVAFSNIQSASQGAQSALKGLVFHTQKVQLSSAAHSQLTQHMHQSLEQTHNAVSSDASEKIFLGMNGLPVLNQGEWGSCVTFAVTGAIDAYYGFRGSSQISQLCDLELGVTLHTSNESEGGWNGANGDDVLAQISQYGFLTASYQEKRGCGGLKAYPAYSDSHGFAMSVSAFERASPDHRFTDNTWHEIMGEPLSDEILFAHLTQPEATLSDVKSAIRRGHRLSIGFLLDDNVGNAGAVGSYRGYDDVWMLNDSVLSAFDADFEVGAHEVIVTGFDDGCISVSVDDGQKQVCGYLVLRNSWSSLAGDAGNYYLTYNYFNTLMDEAYEIG